MQHHTRFTAYSPHLASAQPSPLSQLAAVVNSALSSLLHGKATMQQTANLVVITVPYYSDHVLTASSVNMLGQQLASMAGCLVELRLVRLLAPFLDADILARFLSRELHSSRFRKVVTTLFNHIGPIKPYTRLPVSYTGAILGVKIRLAGRLLEEPTQPRQTIQTASMGTFASGRLYRLQAGSYTTSNSKGAYTVKVWLNVKA